LGEVDFVADQFAALDAPMSLTVFSGADEAFLTELRFYVIVQQAEKEEPVYWFRMYSRQKELAHSRLFGIMMQPGQFDQVREPMFLFDQYFRLRCDGRGLCSSFGKTVFRKYSVITNG
jgi:hypothetical protein